MPSVTPPPNQEPDNKQAIIERQAEIIADLQKTVERERSKQQPLLAHIESCNEEIRSGDTLCAWTTGIGTVGWVLALYFWTR